MRRAAPWLVALLGAALVVAGVVVFAAANRGPVDFGWAAYAPLEQTRQAYRSAIPFTDSATVLWTGQHLLGAVLLVLGLLVVIGDCCWLLGRRAGRREALRT